MQRLDPKGSTPAVVGEDGSIVIQVPNVKLARLIQLGVHVERAAKQKQLRRRMERQSRRRNRRSH